MGNNLASADHILSTPAKPRFPRGFSAERGEYRLAEALARRERENIAEMNAAPLREGLCYFIGDGEGIVKIGFSKHLWQRVNRIKGNTGPIQVRLLATARGGRSREMHYHRKFAAHAQGGEWFDYAPEIAAEVALLNTLAPPGRQSERGRHNASEVRND